MQVSTQRFPSLKMRFGTRLINSIRLLRRSRLHYLRMRMVEPPFWLSANGKTCRVVAGNESGAGSCYSEVAVEDCYRIFNYSKRAKPRVIVDIGANIGMFSKLCSMLFPEADIYAYEPNPSALNWLRQNADGTRIQVLPVAVAESSAVVKLDTSCDSTIGRVVAEGGLSVECMASSEVGDGREIDLLKMDCEGSEWSILRDPSLLRRTKEFCLEYHLFDGHSLKELRRLIEASGHRIVKLGGTKDGGKFGLLHSVLQAPPKQ